jgi:predicted PP-loop superfamily ATPase
MSVNNMEHKNHICSRCILPGSFPRIQFDKADVCSVCREYDQWTEEWKQRMPQNRNNLEKICREAKAKNKDFDALIPLSGGKDSTYVLYVACQKLGLKCMAYTLDFGYLSDFAKRNIENTCRKLGVEHVYYRFNQDLMNRLFALFIKKTGWFCSPCMRAIGMSQSMLWNMCDSPLVITGSSLRTELPLSREMFQDGRVSHVSSVLEDESIAAECRRLLYTNSLSRKMGYVLFLLSKKKRLSTYARFNLADYVDWNYDTIYNTIKKELDWQSPDDGEHMDCIIHPVQKYIQNRRFPGLEQERLVLARLVMAGQISREQALRRMERPVEKCSDSVLNMFLKNIGMSKEEFDGYIDMGPRHLDYDKPPDLATRIVMKFFPSRQAGEY